MILNRTHQESLRDLLKLVGTTQKILADEIGYAASALSEALRFSDPKSINEAKWDEIARFFEKRIEATKADLERRSLLTRAEQLLQELRSGSAGPTIHIPGSALPANATNYVERACDSLLFHTRIINVAEQPASFPAILVRGGIQSGRSSLLQRLAWVASRAGHDSRSVDMSKLVAGLRSTTLPPGHLSNHIFRLVFEKFFEDGDRLQLAISQTSEFQLRSWVSAFLELASDLSKHTFFILDSVDDLLRLSDGPRTYNDLTLFLSTIRDERPDYVSTIVVFSTSGWRYLHGSPYANAAVEVVTAPFNEMMIVDLLQKLSAGTRSASSERVAKVLFAAFRGQPHLTHLAAFMLKNQSSGVDDVLPRILGEAGLRHKSDGEVSVDPEGAVSGPYRTHWERMRRNIQHLLRELEPTEQRSADDPAAEDRRVLEFGSLLRDVLAMVDEGQAAQSAQLFDRLQTLGLLQGPYPGLLPPFYRAAIQMDVAYRRVNG